MEGLNGGRPQMDQQSLSHTVLGSYANVKPLAQLRGHNGAAPRPSRLNSVATAVQPRGHCVITDLKISHRRGRRLQWRHGGDRHPMAEAKSRSIHHPSNSQSQVHCDGDRDPFTVTSFDGLVPIREQVDKMTLPVAKTRNIKHRTTKLKLDDIPEETELHVDIDAHADANPQLEEACVRLETDLQVLRRSLDMGILVLCLGLGYMVSRASITKFRTLPKFSSLISSSFL